MKGKSTMIENEAKENWIIWLHLIELWCYGAFQWKNKNKNQKKNFAFSKVIKHYDS